MKIVPRVMLTALFCAALIVRVNADPVSSQLDPTVNPHALEDPDGVPLQVTHPELFQPSQADLDKKKQADDKAKDDDNWLLRGYEQQMRQSTSTSSTHDFINQISSSKELSDLAGIPYLGNSIDTKTAFKTGMPSSANPISLRVDPSLNNPMARASSLLSKPFFSAATPLPGLSASEVPAPLLGNGASQSSASYSPPPPRAPLVTPPPEDSDSMALSSPGLVAAESSRVSDGFNSNLTLDLPQDSDVQNGDHVTTNIPELSLPLKTNAERLARQNAAMGLATKKATTTTIVTKPVTTDSSESETVPITRPSFGPSAIADPHNNNFFFH